MFDKKRELIHELGRTGREDPIQRCRADGKTGRSGLGNGCYSLRPVNGTGYHHRLGGDRPADPANQIRHVALEAVGEQVEAMNTIYCRQPTGALDNSVGGPLRALGWPTTSPGKG